MTTLKQSHDALLAALETASNGLHWYREMYPDLVNESDHEAQEEINNAIQAAEALSAQDDGVCELIITGTAVESFYANYEFSLPVTKIDTLLMKFCPGCGKQIEVEL